MCISRDVFSHPFLFLFILLSSNFLCFFSTNWPLSIDSFRRKVILFSYVLLMTGWDQCNSCKANNFFFSSAFLSFLDHFKKKKRGRDFWGIYADYYFLIYFLLSFFLFGLMVVNLFPLIQTFIIWIDHLIWSVCFFLKTDHSYQTWSFTHYFKTMIAIIIYFTNIFHWSSFWPWALF